MAGYDPTRCSFIKGYTLKRGHTMVCRTCGKAREEVIADDAAPEVCQAMARAAKPAQVGAGEDRKASGGLTR